MGTVAAHKNEMCQWHESIACQFDEHDLHRANGKLYCKYHLPLGDPGRPADSTFAKLIQLHPTSDFTGVQFPKAAFNLGNTQAEAISLRHCVFADGIWFDLPGKKIDASNCRAVGFLTLRCTAAPTVAFRDAHFCGRLQIQSTRKTNGVECRDWSFSGAVFHAGLDSANVQFVGSLDLNGVSILGPVSLSGTEFPQLTTAHELSVEREALAPSCEASYREARNEFNRHRNRELEGKFYALEKRCHRRSLPRTWKHLVPRILSGLYDVFSEYG